VAVTRKKGRGGKTGEGWGAEERRKEEVLREGRGAG